MKDSSNKTATGCWQQEQRDASAKQPSRQSSEQSDEQPGQQPTKPGDHINDGAMNSLDGLRHKLDAIDRQLVPLLDQRASISRQVGDFKKTHDLPILQPEREEALLQNLEKLTRSALPTEHLRAIYKEIFSSSRALQKEDTVGYLGPEGTFSHMACLHFFGASASTAPYSSIRDVFQALERNDCQYAVIPIENSLYGTVSESFDMLISHTGHAWHTGGTGHSRHTGTRIIAEHIERIHLSLLSAETSFATIRTVFSHSQPLGQCAGWLKSNLPQAKIIPVESTAAAALNAAQTPQSAAIGHARAGLINNLPLNVLAGNIEDLPNNWTRFFILHHGAEKPQNQTADAPNKSTLTFSVADNPGSLAHVLNIFASANANLSKLESRPNRTVTWKYIFFADLNCNVLAPEYAAMLNTLSGYCHDVRVLGTYTACTTPFDSN